MDNLENKKIPLIVAKEILYSINFSKHSCLDIGWDFEIKEDKVNDLFLIRTTFKRKDINSGEFGSGFGRWHTTPASTASEKSIVMTAWVCVKMIIEHELLEGFEYRDIKVFDPHKSLNELIYPKKF